MVNMENLTKLPFYMKIAEFVLGIICIGLTSGELVANTMPKTEVVHAAYFGFFMITAIIIVSYILDTPIRGMLMMVISFCAGVMYFTAGALNLEFYDKVYKNGQILGAGIMGIITGMVFVADFILSWMNK